MQIEITRDLVHNFGTFITYLESHGITPNFVYDGDELLDFSIIAYVDYSVNYEGMDTYDNPIGALEVELKTVEIDNIHGKVDVTDYVNLSLIDDMVTDYEYDRY